MEEFFATLPYVHLTLRTAEHGRGTCRMRAAAAPLALLLTLGLALAHLSLLEAFAAPPSTAWHHVRGSAPLKAQRQREDSGTIGAKPQFLSDTLLAHLREAEIKHGRLTMVALAGWPVAEVLILILKQAFPPSQVCTGTGCMMDETFSHMALSLEDIQRISFAYWGAAAALGVAAELSLVSKQGIGTYTPGSGDIGFDPLGLAKSYDVANYRKIELDTGRVAMAVFMVHYAIVLMRSQSLVIAHQLWGEVCVYNLRGGTGLSYTGTCFPSDTQGGALDTTLSLEIAYRVLTGFYKEPWY